MRSWSSALLYTYTLNEKANTLDPEKKEQTSNISGSSPDDSGECYLLCIWQPSRCNVRGVVSVKEERLIYKFLEKKNDLVMKIISETDCSPCIVLSIFWEP